MICVTCIRRSSQLEEQSEHKSKTISTCTASGEISNNTYYCPVTGYGNAALGSGSAVEQARYSPNRLQTITRNYLDQDCATVEDGCLPDVPMASTYVRSAS